ncbi:VOC family protein [Streptomyces netropsis]|uniref:VOC family protein n=1 Tax=Streptomyces netropsis TaxID=55404 RepID=UPI00379E1B19
MDALYPRLLVEDFTTAADFWQAALRDLLGIEPARLISQAGYASWDLDGQTLLALFSRTAIAEAIGTAGLPSASASQDTSMLALRVTDVDHATARLGAHGATVVAEPQARPEWGLSRAAHLRAPDGTLIELQSY